MVIRTNTNYHFQIPFSQENIQTIIHCSTFNADQEGNYAVDDNSLILPLRSAATSDIYGQESVPVSSDAEGAATVHWCTIAAMVATFDAETVHVEIAVDDAPTIHGWSNAAMVATSSAEISHVVDAVDDDPTTLSPRGAVTVDTSNLGGVPV